MRTTIERVDKELPHTEGAGHARIAVGDGDQINPGRGRHFNNCEALVSHEAVLSSYRTTEAVTGVRHDELTGHRLDQRVDRALSAVGHRHQDAFRVRENGKNASFHCGGGNTGAHGLLKGIGGQDESQRMRGHADGLKTGGM